MELNNRKVNRGGLSIALCLLVVLMLQLSVGAQPVADDYKRADEVSTWDQLTYQTKISSHWVSDSLFWYKVNTRKGTEYRKAVAPTWEVLALFDQEAMAFRLQQSMGDSIAAFDLSIKNEELSENGDVFSFDFKDKRWHYDLSKGSLESETLTPSKDWGYWAASRDELDNDPVTSPDGKWTAFIRDYNVYVRNHESKMETLLSSDGSEGDLYSSYLVWSPDSKKVATFQVRQHVKKFFQFVEAAPKDQFQPKLHTREYLKPGDAVPIKRPALFDLSLLTQIPVDGAPFENQFELGRIQWLPKSKSFTFDFNQRGHQRFQVVSVDAKTGKTKVIVDETSETYVEYFNLNREVLGDTDEIIWKSQRDGYYHLYLIDIKSGAIKKQITKGNWIVREIVKVDHQSGEIWFKASGLKKGEDPYNIHLCKIKKDGSGMIDLTPENANHNVQLSSDNQWILDSYSRVDVPPVFVLRDGETGKVVRVLEEADIADLLAKNWKAPEVFVFKARDNKTDIWGIIYRPSNFDPNKSYPVIEYIYAGPGSNYVPKDFRANYRFSGLAELGFIVVQMDGMGTGNRSKAFEEVCWKNLKEAGFPDRIPWIKAAAKKYPYMDLNRVGLYGGSAGGQNTVCGLLDYPEFYKAGVAACGCYDNRMDKIWWNEMWMGYPIGTHYAENSAVVNAHKLESELMLILGEMDDNVDPASTMQLVDALIKADKEFELVVLPGMNHTLGGEYGERKRRDFFIKHLIGEDRPEWNKK